MAYHDGWRVVETRNGSGLVLGQNVWGLTYVDELIQTGVNQDLGCSAVQNPVEPAPERCERFFWIVQDANYNVVAALDGSGRLAERYEYTPYGQRSVFGHDWLLCDANDDGLVNNTDLVLLANKYSQSGLDPGERVDFNGDGLTNVSDTTLLANSNGDTDAGLNDPLCLQPRGESGRGRGGLANLPLPLGLCDFGHQGLMFDKEFGTYDSRGRVYHPRLARHNQRDGLGYIDGMSLYERCRSRPTMAVDPWGTQDTMPATTPATTVARAVRDDTERLKWILLGPATPMRDQRGLGLEDGLPGFAADISMIVVQKPPPGKVMVQLVHTVAFISGPDEFGLPTDRRNTKVVDESRILDYVGEVRMGSPIVDHHSLRYPGLVLDFFCEDRTLTAGFCKPEVVPEDMRKNGTMNRLDKATYDRIMAAMVSRVTWYANYSLQYDYDDNMRDSTYTEILDTPFREYRRKGRISDMGKGKEYVFERPGPEPVTRPVQKRALPRRWPNVPNPATPRMEGE